MASSAASLHQRGGNHNRECFSNGFLFIVEPVVILYFLAKFPIEVISQQYVLDWFTIRYNRTDQINEYVNESYRVPDLLSHGNESSKIYDEAQLQTEVQSATSIFSVYKSLVCVIPAVVSSIAVSSGGDYFGVRFAIMLPLFGVLVYSANAFCVVYFDYHIAWLILGKFLHNCCGSLMASILVIVTHTTASERRLTKISRVETCKIASRVMSPIGVGLICDVIGYANALLIITISAAFNLVYVFSCLPTTQYDEISSDIDEDLEDIDEDLEDNEISEKHVNSKAASSCVALWCGGKNSIISIFSVSGPRRWKLVVLMMAFLVTNIPLYSGSIWRLFMMNSPLCWTIKEIGFLTAAELGFSTVGGLVSARVVKRCMTDGAVAVFAGAAATASCIYTFFVRNSTMMYIEPVFSLISVLLAPSIRSATSVLVSQDEQSALFGAIASVEVFCSMMSKTIFGVIYSSTLYISSGFVFLTIAAFYACGCVLNTIVLVGLQREKNRFVQLNAESKNEKCNQSTFFLNKS